MGNLRQDIVYVFEVSVGLTGKRSVPVNSKTKFGWYFSLCSSKITLYKKHVVSACGESSIWI